MSERALFGCWLWLRLKWELTMGRSGVPWGWRKWRSHVGYFDNAMARTNPRTPTDSKQP